MPNTEQLIKEVSALTSPNAGIEALVATDYCIMDETGTTCPYKEENRCPDYKRCDDSEYMLACLQSRDPDQIASWAIEVYYTAMDSNNKLP